MTLAPRIRLDGMKAISARLRLSPRQVRRLAHDRVPSKIRLPLFRLTAADGRSARLYAYLDELDTWERRMARAWQTRPASAESR